MKKIINFVIQACVYFIIVFFLFLSGKKFGIISHSDTLSLALDSTVGWAIFQGVLAFRKVK